LVLAIAGFEINSGAFVEEKAETNSANSSWNLEISFKRLPDADFSWPA
jgi:hypothetical protein